MKKNKKNLLILLLLALIIITITFISGNMFGSNIDWLNQHVMIPDYFRKLFYENKTIIPQISWNLGLGENIYYLSYYGFLNPIILISYFLPFIPMIYYIIITSIILYLLSIYLFYKWINPKFPETEANLLTILFLLSGPLLYHFHKQIIFVNFFPWLLLCLIHIDKDSKYKFLYLSIFIFLMIMSSYYYSIVGILTIIIYYLYSNYDKKLTQKLNIFFPIIISMLLSGILTIPTLYTILSSRGSGTNLISIFSLIIPKFSFDKILYGSYATGLTAILIPALLSNVLSKKNNERFLGIVIMILFIFPIFCYLLNGGLYIRYKVFIPLIPILLLCIGEFLIKIQNDKKIDYFVVALTIILSILGILNKVNIGYYIDLLGTYILIKIYTLTNKKGILYIPLILEFLILFITYNIDENYVKINDYNSLINDSKLFTETIKNDTSFYRTSNTKNEIEKINLVDNINIYRASIYSSITNNNYYDFYHNILNSNNNTYNSFMLEDTNNIIVNRLLGVKYILSDYELGYGYELLNRNNNTYIYKNNYPLSIGYATSNIYTSNIKYPYNQEAMLKGILVDNSNNYFQSSIETNSNNYTINFGNDIIINKIGNTNILEVSKDSNITIDFIEPITNKLLFIEIKGLEPNSCKIPDISIKINDIENSLSCDTWIYPNMNNTFNYLINDNLITSLNINIKKGTYKITEFNLYSVDNTILENEFDEMTNISIKDNKLTGDIIVTNDGYMNLSIPYDKGFTVNVDNESVEYEKVNYAFIGFPIKRGNHKIEITYQSPYYKLGLSISIFGLFLLLTYFFKARKD